jgi:ppGpp synthetase/RelA/SpoT-type nucleotidyltranferase
MAVTTPGFTKGQVNRAGALWAEFFEAIRMERTGEWIEDQSVPAIENAVEIIEWWRLEHAYPLRMASANLRHYAPPTSDGRVPVTQRLKRFGTIVDKLLREPTMKLSQMGDVGGVRAQFPDQDAVYQAARKLRKNWEITKTKDYAAEPKSSGYRAVHLVARKKGRLVEIQLRTPYQDLWANIVEDDSRRLRIGYKSGVGEQAVHDYYVAMSELFALRDRGEEPDRDFIDRLHELQTHANAYLHRQPDQPRR